MKIKFLKKHGKNNAGDVIHLDEAKANYLARMKVVEIIGNETPTAIKPHVTKEKETKVIKQEPKEVKVIKKAAKKK